MRRSSVATKSLLSRSSSSKSSHQVNNGIACPAHACTSRLTACSHIRALHATTKAAASPAPAPATAKTPAIPSAQPHRSYASSTTLTNTSSKRTGAKSSSSTGAASSAPNAGSVTSLLSVAEQQQQQQQAQISAAQARQAMRKVWSSPSYQARYRALDPAIRLARNQVSWESPGKMRARIAAMNATPVPNSLGGESSISTTARDAAAVVKESAGASVSSFTQATQARGVTTSSAAASPRSHRDRNDEDDSSDWAFGGGSMSQSGPSIGARTGAFRFGTGADLHIAGSDPAPLGIVGDAGKGAVPNYGRRNRIVKPRPEGAPLSEREKADREFAASYKHEYAPSTRTPRPLPQHTYFSSPSSSFNASNFVAPGTVPPLSRVLSAAGVSEYLPGTMPKRKKTALIMPGQGSQYVAMGKNMYKTFRSARDVWHQAEEALLWSPNPHRQVKDDFAETPEQREKFEAELAKTAHLDPKQGFAATGTGITRGRRGWLRDLVFSGDQLDLTRSENAQPAILTCTLAFLTVLREEFSVDLVKDHVCTAAGHGTGNYASMVAAGACDFSDAVRLLRHRGLASTEFLRKSPVLFPPGCIPPASIYETWGFSNAGSGKGVNLLGDLDTVQAENEAQNDSSRSVEGGTGWRRSQMSGVVIKPGKLQAALMAVEKINSDIKAGRVPAIHTDEFVEVANYNSSLQIVLAGTKVGVSYACDILRARGLGAKAVNLPVSGPYHTSIMQEAANFLRPAVAHLPLRNPKGLNLISSFDGEPLPNVRSIRDDLNGAFARPVRWHDSIETMVSQGVERFICLGPGRACAHLLSKELAYRDRIAAQQHERGLAPPPSAEFEVWSVASVEDVLQLGGVLEKVSASEGHSRPEAVVPDNLIAI